MKDVTEVNEADGKTLCGRITPIPENLTVHAWDMSMQVGHGYNSCPSVIVVTLLRMSCNMHLFDKDLLTHIEIERLVTDLCHL